MTQGPEAKVETLFRELVRQYGGVSVKMAPTEAGVPDRLVMHRQGMFLVELKAENGRLSEIQKAWHHRLLLFTGQVVHVLKGKDEVRAWCARYLTTPEAFGDLL